MCLSRLLYQLFYFHCQFGFGQMFPEMPGRSFNQTYRCYSVSMLGDREDVERGGKSMYCSKLQIRCLSTLEPRYNTVRYNTNSDITRMCVGPQFLPNLPFSYLLNVSMFSKRVNTVIKMVNYFTLTLSQLSKLSHPCLSPSILR